jgi:DNA-binding transcriptional regulator GbsR (MarR family)
MHLSPLVQRFVLHFGEMGSRWGINRTVGQIYALIYLSEAPLNADQIVDALGFSRSNVAMGLKELSGMNLVTLKHIPDDRKDYYTTHADIWDILRNLAEERRKREVEPTLSMLRSIIMEQPNSEKERHAQDKMHQMHDLIDMLNQWYLEMQGMETEHLVKLLKMGEKVYKLYQFKDKLTPSFGKENKEE